MYILYIFYNDDRIKVIACDIYEYTGDKLILYVKIRGELRTVSFNLDEIREIEFIPVEKVVSA